MFKYRRKKYPRLQISNRPSVRLSFLQLLLICFFVLTFASCQLHLTSPAPSQEGSTAALPVESGTTGTLPGPASSETTGSATSSLATDQTTASSSVDTQPTNPTTANTSQTSTSDSSPATTSLATVSSQPTPTRSPETTVSAQPSRPPTPPTDTRKTGTTVATSRPGPNVPATPTPIPTKAPDPPAATATPPAAPTATPAAATSFPATNYGAFFRDQYGGNSQVTKSDDGAVLVDTGSTANGVVLVRVDGISASKKVKAIVVANNNTYQYDIVERGKYVGLPLQLGNGDYNLTVYEQVAGTSYVAVMALNFPVSLASSLKPYTAASIISDFSRSSKAVAQAASLCKGINSQDGKVNAIYNWIASNISYDTALANNITKNKSLYESYLPDPDKTMASRKGICFDYASLMCAMLRSQGIPTRLVKGSTQLGYHAWNEVYFKGQGWVVIAGFRLVEINGSSWVLLDTTWAAAGWSPEKIKNTAHNKQRVY